MKHSWIATVLSSVSFTSAATYGTTDLSGHLQTILSNSQYTELVSHGCHCSRLLDPSSTSTGGLPVDNFDSVCRNYFKCKHSSKLPGSSAAVCDGTNINELTYTVNDFTDACTGNDCAKAMCNCVDDLANLLLAEFDAGNNLESGPFNCNTDLPGGNGGGGQEAGCRKQDGNWDFFSPDAQICSRTDGPVFQSETDIFKHPAQLWVNHENYNDKLASGIHEVSDTWDDGACKSQLFYINTGKFGEAVQYHLVNIMTPIHSMTKTEFKAHNPWKALVIVAHSADDAVFDKLDLTRGEDWVRNEVLKPGESQNLYTSANEICTSSVRPVITIYDVPTGFNSTLINPLSGSEDSFTLPTASWPASFMYEFMQLGYAFQANGSPTLQDMGRYNAIWYGTKAVNRVIDIAEGYLFDQEAITKKLKVVVQGTSKRGWISTFVGGTDLDNRVLGVVSTAFDFFNAEKQFHHHHKQFGGFTYAFGDMVQAGLVNQLDNPVLSFMLQQYDPIMLMYHYKKTNKPYMLQMITQDEFFTVTDHEVYLDELTTIMGDLLKWRTITNSFHFMLGHEEQAAALTPKQRHALDVVGDFANTIYAGFDYPCLKVDAQYPDNDTLVLEVAYPSTYTYAGHQAWTGDSPDLVRKDFRLFDLVGFMTSTPNRNVAFYPSALSGQVISGPGTKEINGVEHITYSTTIEANGNTYSAGFFRFNFVVNGVAVEVGTPTFVVPRENPFGDITCDVTDSCDTSILR